MPVVVKIPVAEQQTPQPPHPKGAELRSQPVPWGSEHWNQFGSANALTRARQLSLPHGHCTEDAILMLIGHIG